MEIPLILSLGATSVSLTAAGGKGMNLARLAHAGFAVPPAFIVSTAAYDAFVRANDLVDFVLYTVQETPPDAPQALEKASTTIRARFAAGRMPPFIIDALRRAYAALGRPPVAVRSSATAEDLPGLSFAGQQDTYLNIVGDDALQRAVIDCWSSLWTARAIGYRARNGIAQGGVALAVVVQEMVPSETSGVLFTANPLTGKRTETVIDATLGLGEALVSGQVEPDHYVVDTEQEHILDKALGAKAFAIHGTAGGGTVAVAQDAAARQALTDEEILELARLGSRVAETFDAPQDIEWAGADGRFYLLQSRPITTLYPAPEGMPAEPLRAMFSFAAVQGMLDPITPLGRDVIRAAFVGASRLFGYRYTVETQHTIREAGERLWVDITGLVHNRIGRRLALGALEYIAPGARQALKSLIDRDRFPSPGPLSARTALRLVRVLFPAALRAARTFLRPDAERERLRWQLEQLIADTEARFAAATTFSERVALVRDTADRAFNFVLPQFVPRFGVGMATYNLLTHLAAGLPDGTYDTQAMMRFFNDTATTEMDLALWQTARAIRDDRESAAHLRQADVESLSADYLNERLPARAQEAVGAFLERYGMRGLGEIDLGRPRWRQDPSPIMQVLCSYLRIESADQAPDVVFELGRAAAEAEIARLIKALRSTRVRMRALVGLREHPMFAVIRIFGFVREYVLADGQTRVQDGLLSHPDDVFFLHLRELNALAAGEQRDWKTLVQDRRRAYERERLRKQIPRLLLSTGEAFHGGVATPEDQDGVTALYGRPVSPGVVEGTVRVVFDPRSTQLAPGEILVCPGTDPSWTPLFLTAGGLVMEVGGMMTHGAVVAREVGIPAVASVHEATRRLRTGQQIRVDGSTGQVVALED
jgi:pyruvate,water dikinase